MRIFLSSTYEDLVDHRAKAASAIERLGQQGVRMEVFGARPSHATTACLDEIEKCEAMVGIYAHRYGHVADGSDTSIVEQEFDHAVRIKTMVFCFFLDDNYPWLPRYIDGEPERSRMIALKRRIAGSLVIENFTTADDLAFKIAASLGRYLLTARVTETLENIPGRDKVTSPEGRTQVARRVARLSQLTRGTQLLLVNDVPQEMATPIKLFEEIGIIVRSAATTREALDLLAAQQFDVVVSDMARGPIQDEGIRFLKAARAASLQRLTIFTVGRYQPERGTPPYAFGITDRVDELLNLVLDAIERVKG
jgi:CheY-like chemotaxis protein